ncbi:MAG: PadR family transcriptional regulator [Candidatus Odinarchaeota archaeon]|nr:PadR family transcriptional regulator [Candidatus Odinarchaeota archaeon]
MLCNKETYVKILRKLGIKYSIPPPILSIFILKLLSKRPMHGYQITEELAKLADTKIPRQIVYFILKKYENAGVVKSTWVVEDESKPKKKYFITEEGKDFLKNRIDHLKRLISLLEEI